MIKCKNCGNVFEGNFCNNCGQSSKIKKIDAHFLWHDVEHGIFHYDSGIIYSLKQLFLKPGIAIREFMEGKRVGHFRPISLAIILATLYALIYHGLGVKPVEPSAESEQITEAVLGHYYWFVLLSIPIYAIGTYVAFYREKYNFAEYIVFESFKASQRLVIHIASLPLHLVLDGSGGLKYMTSALLILDIALIFWTNLQFFQKFSKIQIILRSLVNFISYFILLIIISILVYFLINR